MLKKMFIRKIAVATSILLIMLMLYLIPANEETDLSQKGQLEYIYPNDLEVIYLLDSNNYLSRTKISVSNKDEISKAIDLIEGLTIDGKKQSMIPNGFHSLLPSNTKILDIKLDKGILSIDFSKDFNKVTKEYE